MSYTQVPPNSTGNKIDTITFVEGADTVHRQVVSVADNYMYTATLGATNRISLQYAAVLSGGSGYVFGEIITLTGGTFATAATVVVTGVTAGVITSVKVMEIGRYSVSSGTLTQSATTGSGTGATFTCTFANDIVAMVDTSNYNFIQAQTIAYSGGSTEIEGSSDGQVWTNIPWSFTNNGTLNSQVGSTGSVAAGSILFPDITLPFIRIVAGGNQTVVVSLRSQNMVTSLVKQGSSPSTNNLWYTKNIVSAFGSAGHNSSGGKARVISLATTNVVLLSTFLNSIYHVNLCNTGTTWAYLKFFSKSTTPTIGSDTPVAVHGIPPGGTLDINAATSGLSIYGSTQGMGYAITGAPADLDATAIAANQVVGTIYYN